MDYEILVVGLVRNAEKGIQNSIKKISSALTDFRCVSYLVIESDSNDRTLESLMLLSKEIDGFRYLSMGTLKEKHPQRTDRIAVCRNKYLSEINNNPLYKHVEYVLMADLDDVNTHLSKEAIASCWSQNVPQWDVCTANQKYAYYDIYALRHPVWQPNNCLEQYDFLKKYGLSKEKAQLAAIYSKMLNIKSDSAWIEVDSAFGGLGIYKKAVLIDVHYIGLDENGKQVCEHVRFHEQIRKNGYKIYINPKLINGSRLIDSMNKMLIFLFLKRWWNNLIFRPIKNLFRS